MNPPSRSLKELFLAALEVPPADRATWLERECAGDAGLRQHLGLMLAAHDAPQSLLDRPAGVDPLAGGEPPESLGLTLDEPPAEAAGTVIGPYKLLEQIGEGGFGVVFMAEQQQPVRRKVALKVLKPGMDTRQVVARFEAERQALALMDHAHIAKVLDGGETATGRPFFVMDLVKGVPITHYCDQNQLTARERLELLIQVCQAVQHAHQKGIIHRDVKPTNVLVSRHDSTPVVKVIDFGIAKALGQQLTDKTLFTHFAQLIGTPLYMSPEQAGMSDLDVDTRSDIYSLGVLLYELLTGTTPFDQARLQGVGYDELRRIIREEEPPKPSTRISTLGQAATTVGMNRKSDPKQLSRLFRGELDWIVMKALEKDRDRRYETANGLAGDIEHYLNDEPVQACPPSLTYRFRKFARRNKAVLGMAASLLLLAALVVSGLGWIAGNQAARRDKAAESVKEALQRADEMIKAENWAEANAAAQRAAGLLAGTGEEELLQQRLKQVNADLEMVAKLELARLQRAAVKDEKYDAISADPLYVAAFRAYEVPVLELNPAEGARRIAASAIREQLLAALVDWAIVQRDRGRASRLFAVLRLADRDPWRQHVYDALDQRDPPRMARLALQPEAVGQPLLRVAVLGYALAQNDPAAAVEFVRQVQQRHPDDFWINHQLAFCLERMEPPRIGEAIGYYRAAVALHPRSPGAYFRLGIALYEKGSLDEAIFAYRKAIRLQPDFATAHNNLGKALGDKSKTEEAIAEYRKAIELKPGYGMAYANLGASLCRQGKRREGIAAMREAVRLEPDFAGAWYNLGTELQEQGVLEEALAALGKAVAVDPCYWQAHVNLGNAFQTQGRPDKAAAEYRKVTAQQPDFVEAHYYLGQTLRAQGKVEEAIAEYRRTIELKPDHAEAHNNLGTALLAQDKGEEALAAFRQALKLKPDLVQAHLNLGNVLREKGDLAGAIAASRKAIALNPNAAEAYCNLGLSLLRSAEFAEALVALKRGHELGSREPRWPHPSAQWIRDCEQLVELDARMSRVLAGQEALADDGERIAFAELSYRKRRFEQSACFYEAALTQEPGRKEDQKSGQRYNAACSATLAGIGEGRDADSLTDEQRNHRRRQALDWLRAEFRHHAGVLEKAGPDTRAATVQVLDHWLRDPDLKGLRDDPYLQKLPSQEREACARLWRDVRQLVGHAEDK